MYSAENTLYHQIKFNQTAHNTQAYDLCSALKKELVQKVILLRIIVLVTFRCRPDNLAPYACCCGLCAQELLRVNLLKGAKDFFYSNMVIGRATIPLAPITSTPGLHTEDWYKISKADWAEEMGIDEDVTGEVRLGLVYKPFKKLGEGPISGR